MRLSPRVTAAPMVKSLIALVVVVALAACTPGSPPPQRTSSAPGSSTSAEPSDAPGTVSGGSPAPSGGPITSVVDHLLPGGLGVYSPPEGDFDLALDDLTEDIFFVGIAVDEDTGDPAPESNPEAVYRFDPTTGEATKVGGTTLGAGAEVYGVEATNGWVFWTERKAPADDQDGAATTKCQAAKADGSELTTLEKVQGQRSDYGGCGFSAGGGSALWFGRWQDLDTMNVFDTRSGTTVKVSTSPPVPGFARINADVLVMYAHPAARSLILVHVGSLAVTNLTPEPPSSPDMTLWFGLSSQVVAWTEDTGSSSRALACRIDTAAPGSTCSAPVELGAWSAPFDPTSGLVGVVGGYVVMDPPEEGATTELISAQDPTDRTPINGVTTVAGDRLAGVWRVSRGGDSGPAPVTDIYLRVITVR